MIGRISQEVRASQAAQTRLALIDELEDVFEVQRLRFKRKIEHSEDRIHAARMAARRETTETPATECAIERRGHATGHDKGIYWRERNI